MNQSSETIFKKLTNLEQQIQRLKVQAYFTFPKKQQMNSSYSQDAIMKALRVTRKRLWQAKYAKKVKGVS